MKRAAFAMSEPELAQFVEALEVQISATIHVSIQELASGRTLNYKSRIRCKSASVIKIPILLEAAARVHAGDIHWHFPLTLRDSDKVGGAGILADLTSGTALTLRDICMLMIVLSDNTAANMLIDYLGLEAINNRIAELGLEDTALYRKAFTPDSTISRPYGFGMTTAHDMQLLLASLARGIISSGTLCEQVIGFLSRQQYRDGIPRFLPGSWNYAGKTGAVEDVRNDVAIVTDDFGQQFAIAVLCQNIAKSLWTADNPGEIAIAKIARRLLLNDEIFQQ